MATTENSPKFTRVQAGVYATEDGQWAVVSEGHGYVNGAWQALGSANDGWCLCYDKEGKLREDHNAGDNLDWFETKREALAAAPRHMRSRS